MFREEVQWVERVLQRIEPLQSNNQVANLGSSTAFFRKQVQPHIDKHLIEPIIQRGWKVINVDIKEETGVDLLADVTSKDFGEQLENQFALTICTNMLEHVSNIPLVIENLFKVTVNCGYLLITVPYKYKIHHDPIDNRFRPQPQEIVALFNGNKVEIIASSIITINDLYYYRIKKSHIPLWGYRDRIGYYLGKRHKVSGVLLKILKK